MTKVYTPMAVVERVYDGDTAYLNLFVDIDNVITPRCRFAELYCPELSQPGGTEARDALIKLLPPLAFLKTEYKKADDYGRRLTYVYVLQKGIWICANEWMVQNGFGTKVSIKKQLTHPIYSKPWKPTKDQPLMLQGH